jgi:hypothetical protein
VVFEGSYYNTSCNHCNTIHCKHDPKRFMPLTVQAAAGHHLSPPPAEEPISPTKSQLKKQVKRLTRELAVAEEALRAARETTPPSGRKRAREEESPAMSSAEKRARASGMFHSGVNPSPSM